jgi:hypothetical protein
MTQKNPYLIPKENIKKVEEVRELKEEINPAYREFIARSLQERQILIVNKSKLSPAARAKIIKRHGSDYLSEKAFNRDIAMYGPGFFEDVGGFIVKTAATTAAAGAIVATGGAAAPLIGAGMWAGGKLAEEIGKDCDNQFLRSVGSFTKDTGFGTMTSGLFTGEGAVTTAVKNGWSLEKVEKINKVMEYRGYLENAQAINYHNMHKERGKYYDRDCELCNL